MGGGPGTVGVSGWKGGGDAGVDGTGGGGDGEHSSMGGDAGTVGVSGWKGGGVAGVVGMGTIGAGARVTTIGRGGGSTGDNTVTDSQSADPLEMSRNIAFAFETAKRARTRGWRQRTLAVAELEVFHRDGVGCDATSRAGCWDAGGRRIHNLKVDCSACAGSGI